MFDMLAPMPLAVHSVTLPSALACGSRNGQLGVSKLADIGHGGKLEATCAARAWNALWVAAVAAGHLLTWTPGGTYRTFDNQVAAFMSRMQTVRVAHHYLNLAGGQVPSTSPGAQPVYVTRFYMGQVWYLRPGLAGVATPGTSNHGLGLAIDTAVGADPSQALGIGIDDDGNPATATALAWLIDGNADRFGWSWESQSEPWHLNYYPGDAIPQAVIDTEAFFANQGVAPNV